MKKILFGILTFFGIGLSFCSAGSICNGIRFSYTVPSDSVSPVSSDNFNTGYIYIPFTTDRGVQFFSSDGTSLFTPVQNDGIMYFYNSGDYITNTWGNSRNINFYGFSLDCFFSSSSSCEDKDITVYYNSGSSTNITCDGVQAIQINGLSTITSTNTFTPYYNISYTDEDNQKLTESYSKNILYLSGGQYKKTYTGDNERILTDTIESPNSAFSGYLPTFEITGGIEEVSESGNIFNNFAENSVKFTLSNIPSYIQYVILLFILFFILGFIRKFRRK